MYMYIATRADAAELLLQSIIRIATFPTKQQFPIKHSAIRPGIIRPLLNDFMRHQVRSSVQISDCQRFSLSLPCRGNFAEHHNTETSRESTCAPLGFSRDDFRPANRTRITLRTITPATFLLPAYLENVAPINLRNWLALLDLSHRFDST